MINKVRNTRNPTKSHEIPRNPKESSETRQSLGIPTLLSTVAQDLPLKSSVFFSALVLLDLQTINKVRNPTESKGIQRNPKESNEIQRNPTESRETLGIPPLTCKTTRKLTFRIAFFFARRGFLAALNRRLPGNPAENARLTGSLKRRPSCESAPH